MSWAAAQHVITDATSVTNATLSAETTKVIGTVNVAASQSIAVTQATGTSLHAVLDTTSTTAVTQATGTNLHTVVDSGAVTATVASTTLTATVNPAGMGSAVSGRQVVTTAGTAVQFTSQACKVVAITAETDNTGYIVIGDSAVVAAVATRKGTPLAPGDTAVLAVSNMNLLYIDATVSTDGVTWMVLS